MLLQQYVTDHCGGDVAKLVKLIRERSGVHYSHSLVWRWVRTPVPRCVSGAYAQAVVDATGGLVSLPELIDIRVIRPKFKPLAGPQQTRRRSGAAARLYDPNQFSPGELRQGLGQAQATARSARVAKDAAARKLDAAKRALAALTDKTAAQRERFDNAAAELEAQRTLLAEAQLALDTASADTKVAAAAVIVWERRQAYARDQSDVSATG